MLINKRMEGKLRIKRVPFSNFLLWLQSVQIPPHNFGRKGSKKNYTCNTSRSIYFPTYILYKWRKRSLKNEYDSLTSENIS